MRFYCFQYSLFHIHICILSQCRPDFHVFSVILALRKNTMPTAAYISDPCSPARPHSRQTEPCINFAMTQKESRGSFEGRITKEPRPSSIYKYMISRFGIKFKVNVYMRGRKSFDKFRQLQKFERYVVVGCRGDFGREGSIDGCISVARPSSRGSDWRMPFGREAFVAGLQL